MGIPLSPRGLALSTKEGWGRMPLAAHISANRFIERGAEAAPDIVKRESAQVSLDSNLL